MKEEERFWSKVKIVTPIGCGLAGYTDSGQNKMTPSDSRGHDRSLTPQGWADAMAGQWG